MVVAESCLLQILWALTDSLCCHNITWNCTSFTNFHGKGYNYLDEHDLSHKLWHKLWWAIKIPSKDGTPGFICAFSTLLIDLVILWLIFLAAFVEQIQVFPETVSTRLLCGFRSLWMLGIYAVEKKLRLLRHFYPTCLCICAWMGCLSQSGASSSLSCCGLGGGCGDEDWGGEKAFSLHSASRAKGRIPCLFYFK